MLMIFIIRLTDTQQSVFSPIYIRFFLIDL
jgi:hypothetical protein